jgi:hypothetical protein
MQTAFCGQTTPHPPQLNWSEVMSVQIPLQRICPTGQGPLSAQFPAWQDVPAPQTLPHEPQLLLSDVKSTQVSPQRV